MQSRHATAGLAGHDPAGHAGQLTTGIIAGAVTLAAGADAKPPEWIKLTPRGSVTTRDGRQYLFDPTLLAARYKNDGIAIPLDTDHSTLLRGALGEAPNTVGYLSSVEARDDGTHGRVDWIDPARAVQQLRTHRFISPSFHHEDGRATWLHSAALVSAPALAMPALAAAAHALNLESPMKQIAKALGLAEDATEAQCLAALAGRADVKPLAAALGLADTADAAACLAAVGTLKAGGADAGTVAKLQADLSTTSVQLAAIVKATRDKEVADLLDGALRERRIVPAQRDGYAAMCATEDGLKGVRAVLAATPVGLGPSNLGGLAPTAGDIDPVKLAAEARALVDKSGGTLNIADAVMQLTRKA